MRVDSGQRCRWGHYFAITLPLQQKETFCLYRDISPKIKKMFPGLAAMVNELALMEDSDSDSDMKVTNKESI